MQFLCYYYQLCTNHLPISLFLLIGHIVAVATNYLIYCSNALPIITNLIQCFTYLVYQWLPINYQYSIISHNTGNFLPIGSQCFTNHQFTNGIGKFTNSCQWFTIGSYWQWDGGVYLNFRHWNFSQRRKPWLSKYLLLCHP